MKKVIIKVFAAILLVWYSMSIIGFDVHTCSGSGRSFVVTFIEGLTCEDIHPEHVCDASACCAENHEGCCSHHDDAPVFHDGVCVSAKSCCSSDYQVLAITGAVPQNDHDHFDECSCGHCPCTGFAVCETPDCQYENYLIAYIQHLDSGVESACERQACLRVWRI